MKAKKKRPPIFSAGMKKTGRVTLGWDKERETNKRGGGNCVERPLNKK